jgi:outer membrane protein OmpA-like peptidoglycan-associated protein
MPNVSDDRWVASIEKFREVTKWIMAGFGAMITLILGASPATGLGSLEPGCRLGIAILGAALGLASVVFILMAAVDVLRARLGNIQALPRRLLEQIDAIMHGHLPAGIGNTKQLIEARLALPADADDPQARAIENAAAAVTRVGAFVVADNLFKRLCDRMLIFIFPVIIGFGIYEWAVNPPKADAQAPSKPLAIEAKVILTTSPPTTSPPTAPLATNCAAFFVQQQALVCTERLPPAGTLPGGGPAGTSTPSGAGDDRTFVATPSIPIDLVRIFAEAAEDAAKEVTSFSPLDLAKRAGEKFIESASDELGKRTVGLFFSTEAKTTPPGSHSLLIVTAPPGASVQPQPQPQPPPPARREYGPVDVSPFGSNSASLPTSGDWRSQVGTLVNQLKQVSCQFEVRGFADRRGSARHNLYLSLERADSVAKYLVENGIERPRITPQAGGAFGTGFETDDLGDLASNRRVEVRARCEQG